MSDVKQKNTKVIHYPCKKPLFVIPNCGYHIELWTLKAKLSALTEAGAYNAQSRKQNNHLENFAYRAFCYLYAQGS
jgi:hypothetical protein